MATKINDADLLARIEGELDEPTGPSIDGAPLRALAAAAEARTRAEAGVTQAVESAREAGLSWGVIGAVLGVSRQGARQRYGA